MSPCSSRRLCRVAVQGPVHSLGHARLPAIAAAVALVASASTLTCIASTIELDVAFLARSPLDPGTNVARTVMEQENSAAYATMIGKSLHLERGVDPTSGSIPDDSPNYFTSLDATAMRRRLRISNRMSVSQIMPGTFPRPSDPNFFRLTRTDYTGYASASLTDTLLITGGTGAGHLNMSYRIFGTGHASGPRGISVSATVCPRRSGVSSCTPSGVHAESLPAAFDESFEYSFPFTFGEAFTLDSNFYSWIFLNEPTSETRYDAIGAIDASMEFVALSVTDVLGERVANAVITADSGIDYFQIPEPRTASLLVLGVLVVGKCPRPLGYATRKVRPAGEEILLMCLAATGVDSRSEILQ